MNKCYIACLLLLATLQYVNGYTILVSVLGISGSQNLLMYRLAEHLAQKGHDVTVLKAEIFADAKSAKLTRAKELKFQGCDAEVAEEFRKITWGMPWGESRFPDFRTVLNFFSGVIGHCESFVNKTDPHPVFKQLKQKKFDVAIIHLVDFCTFGIAELLDIKSTIWMSTAFAIDPMIWSGGASLEHAIVPFGAGDFGEDMCLWTRVTNVLSSTMMTNFFYYVAYPAYTRAFRRQYGDTFPSITSLTETVQLYFINDDIFFEYPRSLPPNFIHVGGLTMVKGFEKLEPNWQKIVDDAKKGIIVFSMGSVANTSMMPHEWKMGILDAMTELQDFTFIMRLEGEKPKLKGNNVIMSDWLPQKDLLTSPKIKLLISHGGYNSLTEATYIGVPLLLIPLFGDQLSNCHRVKRLHIGTCIEKKKLSKEYVLAALKNILYDESYGTNAKRLAGLQQSKAVSALDNAINWVEVLAEYKDLSMLASKGRDVNVFVYKGYDVKLVLLAIVAIFFSILYLIFCKLCCLCCHKKTPTTKRKRE